MDVLLCEQIWIKLQTRTSFKRLYVGYSMLKHGFMQGCRKIIGLDETFLKSLTNGALLAVVGKDCNNMMFPIAWPMVKGENQLSWTWFLENLF